jgi:hypothetical protein
MRLWTIHPKYLDTKGLLACWREALLAKHVLEGKTQGYKNHPQLIRFKNHPLPLKAINYYLQEVYNETIQRNYHFNPAKFLRWEPENIERITTTTGQIQFEMVHLQKKLQTRDPEMAGILGSIELPEVHPIFKIVAGELEDWEKII